MCYERRDPEQARVCFERDQRKGAYIEREALLRHIDIHCDGCGEARHCVVTAPAADVAPVVHGRWVKEPPYISVGGEYKKALICSQCHSFFVSDGNTPWQMHNYCPNCGARMDGE